MCVVRLLFSFADRRDDTAANLGFRFRVEGLRANSTGLQEAVVQCVDALKPETPVETLNLIDKSLG